MIYVTKNKMKRLTRGDISEIDSEWEEEGGIWGDGRERDVFLDTDHWYKKTSGSRHVTRERVEESEGNSRQDLTGSWQPLNKSRIY